MFIETMLNSFSKKKENIVIRYVLLFLSILLIVGCSSKEKSLMKEMKTHKIYYKMLQKTEKVMLLKNNITKVILTATYLYVPTMHTERNDANETFIIGLYLEDEEVDSLSDIFDLYSKTGHKTKEKDEEDNNILENNETYSIDKKLAQQNNMHKSDLNSTGKSTYKITLNGKKPLEIKKLIVNDSRLKHLSFVTEWNTYALVTFKHIKGTRLKLLFESSRYGKDTLYFSKVAKYVFTQKAM